MSTEENLAQIKGFDRIQAFYNQNRKPIMYAGIALIVVAAAVYYYSNIMLPAKENRAHSELFMAERYFAQDSTEKALYGDGFYKGFIDVADEYAGTEAGNLANYYAGRLLMNKGEFDAAASHLKKVSFDDYFMGAAATMLLGDCQSELGDYEKAAKTYMNAADAGINDITRPKALWKAALSYEAATRFDRALKAMEAIKEDHNKSREAENIDREIARLQARIKAS